MKLKLIIILNALFLTISIIPSSAVDTPSRNPSDFKPSSFAFVFTEGNQGFGNVSSKLVSRQTNVAPPVQPGTHLCDNYSDPKCNVAGFDSFDALSVLNPCLTGSIQPCVKSLSIIDSKGVIHKASLVRTVDAPTFPAEVSVNLPQGGAISLWQTNDFDGIKDYAVTYFIESQYNKNGGSKEFIPKTFSVYISPFNEKMLPSARKLSFQESVYPDGRLGITGTGQFSEIAQLNCVWVENGKCGIEQEFDEGVSADLTINVPNSLTGWLQGRLIDPEISINPIANSMNELTVKAKPADVPSAYASIPYSQTTDEMKELYKNNAHAMSGGSVRDSVDTAGTFGFKYMSAFQNLLGDKAQIKSTSWKFGRLNGVQTAPQNTCLQSSSQILGLVTTNSMLYEDSLPKFENGFLNYKVGGLHYNPDGTTFKGMYDLIMRSGTARCLYGFSNAPVSAEISVVSVGGEKQVATTQISESKDWIHLSAYNFGFSSPTIQMKLIQKAEPSVAPTPSAPSAVGASPQPSPSTIATAAIKKSTITCVKGTTTKKVTAVSPKCPVGYKKK